MDKDINCLNFKGLFGYIENRFGREALRKLVEDALATGSYAIPNKNSPGTLEPVTMSHLTDESYWISNRLSLALLAGIKTVVPGPEPEQTAGQGAVLENLSNRDLFFSRIVGPNALAKKAAKVNRKFNRTKEVQLTRLEKTGAAIQLHYKPGFEVTKDVCNWNLGIYRGLAEASGARAIKAREVKCILDGHDHCEIRVDWQVPSLLTRITSAILRFFTRGLVDEYEKTVADRDRLIEELSASENQYRLLIETQSDMVVQLDPKGRILFGSRSFCRAFGKTEDDLLATPFIHQVHGTDRERTARELNALCDSPYNGRIEHRAVTTAGIRWFSWMATAVRDEAGVVIAVNGVGRDITEQREMEDKREKALSMAAEAKKLALLGQIAGKMAHDFNNILGIIMGVSELALIDCGDPAVREKLELILTQTLRGKNLTKNLVAFAKSQEPKQEFFKINDKIDLVTNLLKKDLENISLRLEYGSNMADVLADPGMIEHALVNLIQNAVHALSKTPAPRIIIRTYGSDTHICFEITDNGCGIPGEHLADIYEPAFTLKGNRDTTGAYASEIKGTGYGMANVKKYIRQHNGSIQVESAPGDGTTFIVRLPVTRRELSPKEKTELTEEMAHFGKYILLVEDEPAIADVQYRILTQAPFDHTVDIAGTGRMAMDLFDRNDYDFVSLDYILPGNLSGMDVYLHIRKANPFIPVLFVSGNLEFLESIEALQRKDPFLDHLSKPCKNIDYVHRLNRLMTRVTT